MSIKGKRWKRPDDVVGIAGALNSLSTPHINFLAAGGFGPLVGDGQLPNYSPEKVVEVYYAFQLTKGLVATADYQLIVDPGLRRRSRAGARLRRSPARELLGAPLAFRRFGRRASALVDP